MIKESLLTQLTRQRTAAEFAMLSRQSYTWLRKQVANLRQPLTVAKGIKAETYRNTQRFLKGGLYFFFYKPKTKDELPYYDSFPLVLVLQREADGFLGLNLHYLPIKYRILFLSKLIAYGGVYNEDDELKRVRITYDILQATTKFKEFRPCLKKYLYKHVGSKMLAVQPDEWDVAIALPVHQFKKEKAATVWQESMQEIKEHT